MLLYGFFGWMKKRQRDKARDKIESRDDWDTGGIVDFGEGILESIIGDEESNVEKFSGTKEEANDEKESLDDLEEVLVSSSEIKSEATKITNEVPFNGVYIQSTKKSKIYNKNTKLANLIDLQDPIKTGVIFKEIFGKPKSFRG